MGVRNPGLRNEVFVAYRHDLATVASGNNSRDRPIGGTLHWEGRRTRRIVVGIKRISPVGETRGGLEPATIDRRHRQISYCRLERHRHSLVLVPSHSLMRQNILHLCALAVRELQDRCGKYVGSSE